VTDRTTRRLLWAGIAAPVLFVTGFLVLGATRPDYDAMRVFVSQLSLGDSGWLQIANFVVTGALLIAFAMGLARVTHSGPGSTWGPRLVAAVGLGFVIAGVFVTDPALGYPPGTPAGLTMNPSWHGAIHLVGALLVFGGLPAAAFVFARGFRRVGRMTAARWSLAGGVALLVFFIGANISANGGAAVDGVAGLLQRLAIVSGFSWLVALGPALDGAREREQERAQPIVRANA
jgi:hypothetical protein